MTQAMHACKPIAFWSSIFRMPTAVCRERKRQPALTQAAFFPIRSPCGEPAPVCYKHADTVVFRNLFKKPGGKAQEKGKTEMLAYVRI